MKTADEAKAQGIKLNDIAHSMKRRASWHDYNGKGLYMVTLVVEGRRPILGTLAGVPKPNVQLTQLGFRILDEEMAKISMFYPNTEVWKTIVMPDHIHFIIYVSQPFPGKGHLSDVIRGFKTGCNRIYRWLHGLDSGFLFESGYNDKILLNPERLELWKHYLDDNPRRLWIKRTNPSLFTIIDKCQIGQQLCSMVGNQFLLDIPDKESVIFHRRYTDKELGDLYMKFMRCGETGGVLVSAAIAPWEKKVMLEAMDRGFRMILLRENGFPEFYKPSGESFDACAQGRLLQISPWEYHMERGVITREQCLFLNKMAEDIVMGSGI